MRVPRDQIPLLAHFFVKKYCDELGLKEKELSRRVREALKDHPWEDMAELEQVIKRAVIRNPAGSEITEVEFKRMPPRRTELDDLSLEEILRRKLHHFLERHGGYEPTDLHGAILEKVEKPLIELILERTRGNQVRAARILGINRNTLFKKMKMMGIQAK